MDNILNFQIFCNSLNQDEDKIYYSQISNNLLVIRDDVLPFSTRGRYAKYVLDHLNKISNSDKFIYKSRWFDSTQIAISYACRELNFELLILTLTTSRDNNSFSEISKTFGAKYKYYNDYEELESDYEKYLEDHTEIPTELEHEISKDILLKLIESINVKYDDVWLTVEDSSMIPKLFEGRANIFIVCVTENVPKIDFKCTKIISQLNYDQSCEPYYPNYTSNPFIDGKMYYHLSKYLKENKDRKVLVFNKY